MGQNWLNGSSFRRENRNFAKCSLFSSKNVLLFIKKLSIKPWFITLALEPDAPAFAF
jgi:hypothetical protein